MYIFVISCLYLILSRPNWSYNNHIFAYVVGPEIASSSKRQGAALQGGGVV
jgi:hypothetical protein